MIGQTISHYVPEAYLSAVCLVDARNGEKETMEQPNLQIGNVNYSPMAKVQIPNRNGKNKQAYSMPAAFAWCLFLGMYLGFTRTVAKRFL